MKKKVSAAPSGGAGGRGQGGARKDDKFSEDSFFMAESKKQRKIADVIDSGEVDLEVDIGEALEVLLHEAFRVLREKRGRDGRIELDGKEVVIG
nr:hypothetical protein CFP56_57184 [Quercus suber]